MGLHTLLVLGQAEVAVPAGHKHNVIGQVLALDLELLHDDDVRLEDVEHGVVRLAFAPWLVAQWVANPVYIPRGDSHIIDHEVGGASCSGWVEVLEVDGECALCEVMAVAATTR